MLRGAIDFISPERIGGWVYSERGNAGGRTILAFIDEECIGAGPANITRQDLADAGLGDGGAGFNFDIALRQTIDLCRVYVKIEGSDFVLLQAGARVAASFTSSSLANLLSKAGTVELMRKKGWLEQFEFDFLKYLGQCGVYDLSLTRPKSANSSIDRSLLDPALTANKMFELICLDHVSTNYETFQTYADIVKSYAKKLQVPIVAIKSDSPVSLFVLEGSSRMDALETGDIPHGAVEYKAGPDRLLFVDLRVIASQSSSDRPTTLHTFTCLTNDAS